jgi:hypothetical protein
LAGGDLSALRHVNGICTGNECVPPTDVSLTSGSLFEFVVTDPTLAGCPSNDPTNTVCVRGRFALLGGPSEMPNFAALIP